MNSSRRFQCLLLICFAELLSGCTRSMTVTLNSPLNEPVYKYMQHISKKIEIIGAARYPELKSMVNTRDRVLVAIHLAQSGRLLKFEFIKSAASPELNHAIADIISYSAPYPPLPEELQLDRLVIHKLWQFTPH